MTKMIIDNKATAEKNMSAMTLIEMNIQLLMT